MLKTRIQILVKKFATIPGIGNLHSQNLMFSVNWYIDYQMVYTSNNLQL